MNESDIERVGVALGNLPNHTGNTRLIKTAAQAQTVFIRLGDQLTVLPDGVMIGVSNGAGKITLNNTTFASD